MSRSWLIGGAALLLAALAFCAADLPMDPLPLSDWTNGTSLLWGGPQDGLDEPYTVRLPPGACGFGEMDPKMWPFFLVTGVSPRSPLVQNRPQASCGTCLEVKCVSPDPKVCTSAASVTVVVTDECADCTADQLNLHAFAFQQIARIEYGSAAIQYRQVECSPTDNITVHVDSFRVSMGGWLRLSLKTVASDGSVVRVELARSAANGAVGSNSTALEPAAAATADTNATAATNGSVDVSSSSTWKSMDNTYGAEWEMSALPAPPYDLRLTDRFGRKVVLSNVITRAGAIGEFPGHGQFPGLTNATIQESTAGPAAISSGPTPTSAPTPTAAPAPKLTPAPSTTPAPKATVSLRSSIASSRGVDRRLLQQRAVVREMRHGARGQKAGPMN